MSLDIHSAVLTTTILASFAAVISLISGFRSIRSARNLNFFRMRRDRMVRGWRLIFLAIIWGGLALIVNSYAEPIAYSYFPPTATPTLSPTITLTPSITISPSITLTPTITDTPSETDTPTITPTPSIPLAIETRFEGELTPPADAVFSELQFTSQGVDSLYRPLEPSEVFTNPVGIMFAVFSYDGMQNGIQWTALWYRNSDLVNFETQPWDGGTGGSGYTEWNPDPEEWLPGTYTVQLFLGLDWKQVGDFTVLGTAVTSTPTTTSTLTDTLTATTTNTNTPPPTSTLTPTWTPWPTLTRTPTPPPKSPTPTSPPTATATRRIYPTVPPPSPTYTRGPTATPDTPTPTITRWPTPTKTPTP